MFNHVNSEVYDFSLSPLGLLVFVSRRQIRLIWRCFLDIYSLALEIQRIASVDFRVSARLVRLAQLAF